ncbi:MAG: hexose kinase [Anaerolineae bacterium]
MILCVGSNPALDHTLVVPNFSAGVVSRSRSSLFAAGGKGLNVARAVQILGEHAWSIGFLAGHTGRYIEELASAEGLEGTWTWVDGETRTCVIIADTEAGEATVINENGPRVQESSWIKLNAAILQEAERVTDVCFSGSLPLGAPLELFVQTIISVRDTGKRVWVDTSGAPLSAALSIPGIIIKINGDEAGAILNSTVNTAESALDAALKFRQRGLAGVVITLGKSGAVMSNDKGSWWSYPPTIKVLDAVGSGDSFLAGIVTACAAGYTMDIALRHAVAAGAANATTVGGGDFPKEVFEKILLQTKIQAL